MKNKITFFVGLLFSTYSFSQNVAINTTGAMPNASSMLDITSTNKGFLMPRVSLTSTTDVLTVPGAANWLMVFNTATVADVTPGMYYWNGAVWVRMLGGGDAWRTLGNTGTTAATNFLGTTDAIDLVFRTNNTEKMRIESAGNVGIGSVPGASAKLHVNATDKGMLIPNVALTSRILAGPITLPATSLLVYNTATAGAAPNNVVPGYYYNAGTGAAPNWTRFASGNGDAWLTTGNAGTTAGTNFIGTTDAQAFVVKTNGAAAANERMRILAGGTGVYNNATPFADDVFSVYGTGYTGAINGLGTFALNGYVGINGTAVYGESTSTGATTGIGVWGDLTAATTATATSSIGVYGRNISVPAGTGQAIGVRGLVTATTGVARGVNGTTASGAGIGVAGFNTATTGNAYGTYGQTASTAGIGVGAFNVAVTGANAIGSYSQSASTAGTGAMAISSAATGTGTGLYAEALSTGLGVGAVAISNGTDDALLGINLGTVPATAGGGVYGGTNATLSMAGMFVNTNVAGTGLSVGGNNTGLNYYVGGSGATITGTNRGTITTASTVASGIGLIGAGNGTAILTPARGGGVVGIGRQYGVMGFATTMVNTSPLSNSAAAAANASAGGYFEVQNGGIAVAWSYVGVREVAGAGGLRKIIGNGTVNTIVKDLKGEYVALSCPETPENIFQDYGQGQLVNGRVHIEIDPILAKNIIVNEKHPLRVFIQLEGDCEGVFITNKSGTGFDVVELKGGNSNTPFSYTIVANRADEILSDGYVAKYSEERFPVAPGPLETEKLEQIKKEEKKSYKKQLNLKEEENLENGQLNKTKAEK